MVSRSTTPLPLDVLTLKLRRLSPPSLSGLLDRLVHIESYQDFLNLVEEYLPERLEEVKWLSDAGQRMSFFASHFADKYFPLSYYFSDDYWDAGDGYDQLLGEIPINYGGCEMEDLHEVDNWRAGHLLMGSLGLPHLFGGVDEGLGVVWLDECANHVDREQLQRLPDGGWGANELHRLLDGTEYEGAAIFTSWLGNNTGNAFMDAHPEYPFTDPWEMEMVEILTADYHQSVVWENQISALGVLLETQSNARYTEMLDFIFQREEELGPPEDADVDVF